MEIVKNGSKSALYYQLNPTYQLVNPAKSELSKTSKQILGRINMKIAEIELIKKYFLQY